MRRHITHFILESVFNNISFTNKMFQFTKQFFFLKQEPNWLYKLCRVLCKATVNELNLQCTLLVIGVLD